MQNKTTRVEEAIASAFAASACDSFEEIRSQWQIL